MVGAATVASVVRGNTLWDLAVVYECICAKSRGLQIQRFRLTHSCWRDLNLIFIVGIRDVDVVVSED